MNEHRMRQIIPDENLDIDPRVPNEPAGKMPVPDISDFSIPGVNVPEEGIETRVQPELTEIPPGYDFDDENDSEHPKGEKRGIAEIGWGED